MKFISTRGQAPAASLSQALSAGLAPDGGLYVPERQSLATPWFSGGASLVQVAETLLAPFFAGDALDSRLSDIVRRAFTFEAPLTRVGRGTDTHLLELFHGPTAAFKDFGARFLAECLSALRQPGQGVTTILVATSGDTGAAVASAFHRRPGFRVVILYPHGRVSPRQAHGLECFGDNVSTLRISGTFDDCQALVKRALGDATLASELRLSSANSISLGRLLPQMTYFANAAHQFHQSNQRPLNLCVPTGNLGNALAALLARQLGAPIGDVVLASNANRVLPDFFAGQPYRAAPTVATVANAMDVGAPSNFERLQWLYPDERDLRQRVRAFSVSDVEIRATVRHTFETHGVVVCPHTATGVHVVNQLRAAGDTRPWAVAATAHPAKFETVVEPLIGRPVEVPAVLAAALARPASAQHLAPDFAQFVRVLRG